MSDKIRYFINVSSGSVYTLDEMQELHVQYLLVNSPFVLQEYLEDGEYREVKYNNGIPEILINEVNY